MKNYIYNILYSILLHKILSFYYYYASFQIFLQFFKLSLYNIIMNSLLLLYFITIHLNTLLALNRKPTPLSNLIYSDVISITAFQSNSLTYILQYSNSFSNIPKIALSIKSLDLAPNYQFAIDTLTSLTNFWGDNIKLIITNHQVTQTSLSLLITYSMKQMTSIKVGYLLISQQFTYLNINRFTNQAQNSAEFYSMFSQHKQVKTLSNFTSSYQQGHDIKLIPFLLSFQLFGKTYNSQAQSLNFTYPLRFGLDASLYNITTFQIKIQFHSANLSFIQGFIISYDNTLLKRFPSIQIRYFSCQYDNIFQQCNPSRLDIGNINFVGLNKIIFGGLPKKIFFEINPKNILTINLKFINVSYLVISGGLCNQKDAIYYSIKNQMCYQNCISFTDLQSQLICKQACNYTCNQCQDIYQKPNVCTNCDFLNGYRNFDNITNSCVCKEGYNQSGQQKCNKLEQKVVQIKGTIIAIVLSIVSVLLLTGFVVYIYGKQIKQYFIKFKYRQQVNNNNSSQIAIGIKQQQVKSSEIKVIESKVQQI